MSNQETFEKVLAENYTKLFLTEEYAYSASKTTPESLASKMTNYLKIGAANKDGKGVKNTCKTLGIHYTYKGIKEFLNK